jgi:hypothetical protein
MTICTLLVIASQFLSFPEAAPTAPCYHTKIIAAKVADSKTSKKQSTPTIMETLNNGKYIRLTDNSTWEIHPKDTPLTQSWIFPVEIIAAPSNDADYPYTLTNSLTGSRVRARRVPDASKNNHPSPS